MIERLDTRRHLAQLGYASNLHDETIRGLAPSSISRFCPLEVRTSGNRSDTPLLIQYGKG
jgi:hypothetical protein